MSSPSVVLVSTSYPSRDNPAAGIFVQRLARSLADSGRVTVIAPSAGGDPAETRDGNLCIRRVRWAPAGIEKRMHGPGGIPAALARQPLAWLLVPFLILALVIAVRRALHAADLVHANWAICGWVASLARGRCNTPILLTLRGADVGRGESRRADRWLLRRAVLAADCVACVNAALGDALRSIVPEVTPEVVPNGVDQAFLDVPMLPSAAAQRLRVGAVGSLIPRKGFTIAVEALARLEDANVQLTIVGDGEERERLAALCTARRLDDRVTLLPARPPDAMPAFLAGVDVLVCPSFAEGRPNVVVEAMAAGRVVIAADIAGMGEIIDHNVNGLLFPVGDADGLAACLARVCGAPELRAALGREARRFIVSEGLTWQACAERYRALYAGLVS